MLFTDHLKELLGIVQCKSALYLKGTYRWHLISNLIAVLLV